MKSAILAVAIIASLALGGAATAADYPVNERPMYGGITKTPEMLRADEQFIDAILKGGYTRATGSDRGVDDGFGKFFRGDHAAAMRAFNQAWLLDPENGSVYHGFAVVLMDRDKDLAGAEAMFKRAIGARRTTSGSYTDYGRFLAITGRPQEAITMLKQSLAMPGVSPDAQGMLITSYLDAGDWPSACAEAKKISPQAQRVFQDNAKIVLARPECAATR